MYEIRKNNGNICKSLFLFSVAINEVQSCKIAEVVPEPIEGSLPINQCKLYKILLNFR